MSTRANRHFRLGAASLTLGGAAFALIQILQGTISEFNPRAVVSVLLAVCIALAGATLARLRLRSQQTTRLTQLLRHWPLTTIAQTDGLTLGVYPARQTDAQATEPSSDHLPPYVPRDIDAALREGLGKGGLVLVTGPPRSGKSRSAFEAATAVLGDRPVVIPVDGAALSALCVDDASAFPADAVWWLDDLDRFLGDLGGAEMTALLESDATIVSTLRDDRWHELIRADGDEGECGRRLRAAARVVHLEGTLTETEAEAARERLGGIDLANGLGDALGAADVGAARRPPRLAPAGRRRPDMAALAIGVATGAVAVALALVIAGGGFSVFKPAPIAEQLDGIRARAAAAGETVVFTSQESFHGFDEPSWLFVLRPNAGSDDLRVYDEVNGELRLGLDFQPHTQSLQDGDTEPGSQQLNGLYDYALAGLHVDDYFNTGERELIAYYTSPTYDQVLTENVELPIIVAWNDDAQRYQIEPLLGDSPTTLPPRYRYTEGDGGYYILHDIRTGQTLRVWPTAGYVVTPATGVAQAQVLVGSEASGPRHVSGISLTGYELAMSAGQIAADDNPCLNLGFDTIVLSRSNNVDRILNEAPPRVRYIHPPGFDFGCTG